MLTIIATIVLVTFIVLALKNSLEALSRAGALQDSAGASLVLLGLFFVPPILSLTYLVRT